MSQQTHALVASTERIHVDSLRGFALFGILITNMLVASQLWACPGSTTRPTDPCMPYSRRS
ncbi:hypothetical protein AB0I30_23405 [Nocardia tengchongensis]|uniref:hypothetical protein n=1 Tax=Nocardia tengchongensis TaxID=2055889 RepID=UPI00340F347A